MTTTENLPYATRTSQGFLAQAECDPSGHAAVTVSRQDAKRFATQAEARAFLSNVGCGRTGKVIRMGLVGAR